MSKYWIRPIPLCQGPRDGSNWTYLMRMGKSAGMCCYVWYIEGSEPKTLVDAGCSAQDFLNHGQSEEDIQSVEEGLGKLGLKPEDIDIVIITHLHFDHIYLASKYKNAKFIIQKDELDYALNPHPMEAKLGYFDKRLFKDLNIEVIEGDKEIIEGVRVVLTPGHTSAGQSVVIETPKGTAVITGFCGTLDNFDPPPEAKAKGFEVVAMLRHINVLQAYDSVLKVKKMADIILPLHEPSFVNVARIPMD